MPLRAIINGKDILAPFMNDEEWVQLKNRVKQEALDVRLPCCGANGYLRTSKHGLHHFVHKGRDNCTSAPETWQHLKAKHDILLACRAAGYDAITEASGEGWRADVLATKGNVKIAFEVQWSSQTWEITQERQQQYKDAAIRGCWFFRRLPAHHNLCYEVPSFALEVTQDGCTMSFDRHSLSLSDFVADLLSHKIKFCEELRPLRQQKLQINLIEVKCWKCQRPYHIYYLSDLKTGCGHSLQVSDGMWGNEKFSFLPEILEAVKEFAHSPAGRHIRLSSIRKRYSKTVQHAYMSFGCPYCNAIFGDWFVMHEVMDAQYDDDRVAAIVEKDIMLPTGVSEWYEHRCCPENGEFCC